MTRSEMRFCNVTVLPAATVLGSSTVLVPSAAVATPGQDPISMIALAIALVLLFELAIQITRLNDRRRARQRAAEGWDSWDPDAPSPIDTSPSAIDTSPSPIDTNPSPVDHNAPGDAKQRLDDVT